MLKLCTILLVVGIWPISIWAGITEEQMYESGKAFRSICQPRFKIPEDTAKAISLGQFPTDSNSKCYINCLMESMQTMKKGKLSYDSTMKTIDMLLPDDYKDDYRQGTEKCKNAVKTKNKCEAAFEQATCFKENIKKFVFP